MSTLRIEKNEDFAHEIHVTESDPRSELVHVKFERFDQTEGTRRSDEMFLTLPQLEKMARFLLRQADEIHSVQQSRK